MAEEFNSAMDLQDKDYNLSDDSEDIDENPSYDTQEKVENSGTEPQDKLVNIDLIFDYVMNKRYAPGITKSNKSNVRRLSKPYFPRDGQLYYRHRAERIGKSGNEYRELLVIRDQDEQMRIIENIHTGSGDIGTAPSLERHLGVERTRTKILERFYWKNVGKDVKKFISACDLCHKDKPVRKENYKIDQIFNYVVNNTYEYGMSKNDIGNLRRQAKDYVAQSGQLYYCQKTELSGNSGNDYSYRGLLVIRDREEQKRIIQSTHFGFEENDTNHCMESHLGIERTRSKILERFYWKNVGRDVREFISVCEICQQDNPVNKIDAGELNPEASEVMVEIGVNITNLPKTEDGYTCIVLAIDYFSKWPEARPLKDHNTEKIARFLFEDIICRHGCVKIQINDQGEDFVNKVSAEIQRLTGTKQHITSGYNSQNRELKDSFIKSIEDHHSKWVECLPAILFAYRTSKHSSNKTTPFQLLYNRKAVLPYELQDDQKIQGSEQH
ncbi:unnamed protein product [Meganyctiphanes norvegica]|uniref:RNA-directed DNA polymerase n=2 Tax=Meganyctiphanes norvegica TaxID=48144 RepID=A0AAV2RFC7_MEGNR